MKKILGLFVFCSLLACQQKKETTAKIVAVHADVVIPDSLSIDFVALKAAKKLGVTQKIRVDQDPVYHATKIFNAIPLKALLEKFSSVDLLNPADYKVIFECEDGYKPEMNLVKLLEAKAYLAISDAEAPPGRDWTQILKDGHEMIAAPFYVIYEGVDPKDGSFKWPYNLVKIHFALANENEAALKPLNAPEAMAGYTLFKQNCQTCHAINAIGGVMGPELNYPKNITEYWKRDDLKGFIMNPAAYRNGVKMPKLTVSPEQAEALVVYLEHMATRKKG